MAWYDSIVGPVKKHVLPAVANYGGQVIGGAVGTVVGGPAGTIAGAAAGKAASNLIRGKKVSKRALKGAALGSVMGPAGAMTGYGIAELTKKRGKRRPSPPSKRRRVAAPATSRRRRRRKVRDVHVVFTVDGDGNVRKKVIMRKALRRLQRRVRGKRVPAMVVPSGSQKGDALATAGRLIASIQSADPKLKSYAKAVMNATARRARKGDPAAKRAVSFLKAAQSANRSKGRLTGFLVTNSGRVVIGSFLQTG